MKTTAMAMVMSVFLTILPTFGGAFAQEEEGVLEERGYYSGIYDEDYADDWFYDAYEYGPFDYGEDEVYGYYGGSETGWFEDESAYTGFYDDEDAGDDWWFDTYDDPGDGGFWDI